MEVFLAVAVGMIAILLWINRKPVASSGRTVGDDDSRRVLQRVETELKEMASRRDALGQEIAALTAAFEEEQARRENDLVQYESRVAEMQRRRLAELDAEIDRARSERMNELSAVAEAAFAAMEANMLEIQKERTAAVDRAIAEARDASLAALEAEMEQRRQDRIDALEADLDVSTNRSERLAEMDEELLDLREARLERLEAELEDARRQRLAVLDEDEASLRRALDAQLLVDKEAALARITEWIGLEQQRVTDKLEREYQLEIERRREA